MVRSMFGRFTLGVVALLFAVAVIQPAWAQFTQGRINVTVLDPQKAVVPGAKLELTDLATGQVRTAETQSGGTYSFVNLPAGKYRLAVSMTSFQQSVYEVTVATSKVTDVEVVLQLGAETQVVEVAAVAPVVDTSSNAIGMNVNIRHIENLPIIGRDITQLARLAPGYSGVQGTNTGTWNGLPSIAQGNNIDGVIASPSRMKFGGNAQAAVSPRLENIEEMTVSTDQLDVNQGFGTSSMQLNYVTRRGGSDYHGRLYWDHRNAALNANSWANNANGNDKPKRKRNEVGGSVGGPVWPFGGWREKMFFFFSLSTSRLPGSVTRSSTFLTSTAQAGDYTYVDTGGVTQTINLFQVAQAYNTANGTSLPTTVNSIIASELSRINSSLSSGTVSGVDLNRNSISWADLQPSIDWYPTFRIDYNATQNLRFNFSHNRTKQTQDRVNQPYFPGSDFDSTNSGNRFQHNTNALGIDWTVSPTILNSFRAGYLSYNQEFTYNSPKEYLNTPVSVGWPFGLRSTMTYYLPVTTFYPVVSFSDTLTWQKGAHTMNFGMSFYRETNRYFNPPEGISFVNLDLINGDPALNAFDATGLPGTSSSQQGEAQDLYALLTGRVVFGNPTIRYPVNGATGQYDTTVGGAFNLKERATAWGLFYQDQWRFLPNLTVNYGVRLDFTGDARDLNRAYHNADESSIYGPSGIGNLFMPGTLTGNQNPTLEERKHVYDGWAFWQPNLGVAWVPRFDSGFLGKITGNDDLVIRASASLRSFTVPYQYFWNNASNYGSFFYQFGNLTPTCAAAPCAAGTYVPGSVSLGQAFPPYLLSPASYSAVANASDFTFFNGQFGNGINGFGRNIGQPYTFSWTVGIQRKFGATRALEVRYTANSTKNQWISYNINEVNIFENGFLQEFINAQNNLAICQANAAACVAAAGDPAGSARRYFSNLGLPGQVTVPILTGAFTGSTTGAQNDADFRATNFITWLGNGEAGRLANQLSGASGGPYLCNLVGDTFGPCANNLGYVGAGAGFPINFFQANPYGAGIPVTMMNDDGYSNYNSLQIDFRQQLWHGLQFDANYTWSHTLGVSTPNDWTGSFTQFTLRDLKHSYGPTLFDLRHVVHVSATYDLPFGKGKQFANQGGVVDKIVGGWTIGTIMTYQTGFPARLTSGFQTFNNLADSGIDLSGLSRKQLQNAVGVYRFPGTNRVSLINPQLLNTSTNASGQTVFTSADLSVLTPNRTPGVFAPPLFIQGPHGFYDDISLTKSFAITERWRFSIQALFINAFNHPVFGQGQGTGMTTGVRSTNFGTVSGPSNNPEGFGRQIEFRLNISF